MKTPHLTLGLLVVSGLGMSVALLPREQELALIRLRDADLVGAERVYEARVSHGDRSAPTLTALSQLEIAEGRIERAIELLKLYVADHPDTIAGWTLLADYARQAQDTELNAAALERLAGLAPDRDRLRELERIYRERGDVVRWAATLAAIIDRFGGDASDYVALARIEAANGEREAALATLQRLEARAPTAIGADIVDLRLRLLADLGRDDEAVAEAAAHAAPATALGLAQTINRRLGAARALAFLAPFAAQPDAGAAVRAAADEYETERGGRDTVLARLDAARRVAPLPPSRAGLFTRLAIAAGRLDDAQAAAEATGVATLPADAVAALVDALWSAQRLAALERVVRDAGPEILASRPMLGAQLAEARGDAAGALGWLASARVAAADNADAVMALAEVEQRLGRADDALGDLDGLVRHGTLPPAMAIETAELYIRLGRAGDGAASFDALRRREPAEDIAAAWALAAAAAGQHDAVAGWLAALPETAPSTEVLEAIYDHAAGRGAKALALAAARRLAAREPSEARSVALAQALLDSGDLAAALDAFHRLRTAPGGEERYVEALAAAFDAGAPVREELRAYWRQRLARGDLVPAERDAAVETLLRIHAYGDALPALAALAEATPSAWLASYVETARKAGRKAEMVEFLRRIGERKGLPVAGKQLFAYALVDEGGPQAALPVLRQLAMLRGGEWDDAYEDALTKLGRSKELRAALVERAARPGLPADRRREIAHRLLDAGAKPEAETLFRTLASGEGPDGADLNDLLYLWGPRPAAGALAWLEQRARTAGPADQAKWLQILAERGAAQAVIAAYDAAKPDADGAFDAYLDALVETGDRARLSAALRAGLAARPSPARLQRIGELARDGNDLPLARQAFEGWVAASPNDMRAQRSLAFAAFEQKDFVTARAHLERYLAGGASDWEASLTLAEIKLRAKDKSAQADFERALHLVEAIGEPDIHEESSKAYLLYRTGKTDVATRLYAALVARRPTDDGLRADYATMLIDIGEIEAARAVLHEAGSAQARRGANGA